MARQILTAPSSYKTSTDGQAGLARFVFMAALTFCPLQTPAAAKNAGKSASDAHVTLATGKKGPSALEKLEDALKQARSESEARALLAQLHAVRLRNLTPAVFILVRHGRALQKQNRLQEAEHDLSSALTLQPDQAILWRFRAMIRHQGQDEHGAIADLGVALQLDPRDAVSWRLLSAIELQRGDRAAALKARQKADRLDPASKQGKPLTDAQGLSSRPHAL